MNKNILVVIVVLLVLVAGGYYFMNRPGSESTPIVTGDQQMTAGYTVNLSTQNNSGQSGTATITEEGGKVKVALTVSGGVAGVAQPAHIHVGACPDVGAVKYPLTSVSNGTSETMLDVTIAQLRSELPLGINVHKSAQEASVYVACGDLAL
jgi:hypothetical protein